MPKREKIKYFNGKIIKTFRVLVFAALFSVFLVFLSGSSFEQDGVENAPILNPIAATVHSPIWIDGNIALNAFFSGNGTTGADWGNAHVIENYEIDAGGSGSGIEIHNTNLYLIIRNVTTINSANAKAGIFLSNCSNVKIMNTNSNNNYVGILLLESSDNNLTGNDAWNNRNGIYFYNSNNNTLSGNDAWNNTQNGIYFYNSSSNTLSGNDAWDNTNSGFFLWKTSNNTLSENVISYNGFDGLYLDSSSGDNEIFNNTIKKNINGNIQDLGTNNSFINNTLAIMPSASFSTNFSSIFVGESVFFTDSSGGGYGIITYFWDFGDSSGNSTTTDPTYQFNYAGIYWVNLTITDEDGDTSEYSVEITVEIETPVLSQITPNPSLTGDIFVNWDDVPNAENYTIYRFNSFITEINGSITNLATVALSFYNDNELGNGIYYYVIIAHNETGNSSISNCESVEVVFPLPDAPTLSTIAPNPSINGNVTLNWNDVPNADNYTIYRYSSLITEINGSVIDLGTVTISNFTDIGLIEDIFYYAIIATNESGSSVLSNNEIITVIFPVPSEPVLDPLTSPGNGDVFLSWNSVVGADNYTIYRYNSFITEINGSVILVETTTNSSYQDVGLLSGDYFYIVIANNESGSSGISNCKEISINVQETLESPILELILPNPNTSGDIILNWSDTPGADNYSVYRYHSYITEINGSVIFVDTTTNSSYNDVGLLSGDYFYVIIAHNETGDSSISNCESIVVDLYIPNTPNAPILFPITPNPSMTGNITLNWSDVLNADNYTVFRYTSLITEINVTVTVLGTVTVSNYNDSGLGDNIYYYAIIANNETGSSDISNCEAVEVDLPEPEAPILSSITPNPSTTGNITLNWSDVPNADNYTVYRSSSLITELNESVMIMDTVIESFYYDNDLDNGTYFYVVIANNESDNSSISNCESITVEIIHTEDNPFEGFSPAAIGALAGGVGLIPIIKALRTKKKKKNKSLNFNGKEKKKKKKKKKDKKKKYIWDIIEPGFLD